MIWFFSRWLGTVGKGNGDLVREGAFTRAASPKHERWSWIDNELRWTYVFPPDDASGMADAH